MDYFSGTAAQLSTTQLAELFHYRYDVFINHLEWDVVPGFGSTSDKIEKDQYDSEDTLYVVAKEQDDIVGCARLLPTTEPYLLQEVFPELLNGQAAPQHSDIWELSRFTSFNPALQSPNIAPNQFSNESTVELLKATLDIAKRHGAKKLITVSPVAVERLLRKAQFSARRVAPPVRSGRFLLVSLVIDVI
ncbi:GNAT family N-acetyltransferase [Vibrio sp. SM6]|uniref:Acyl-homoserine-lactone synthase n=1 Tax=Vibrio agarilyticus TaxID=2726741 RepID=A0A7X8TQY3_9VIBR|nr:acyl-homoserine-lactone synthase [Vibrio agarilyticus]NLS12977.1 GNAT family N-acetyltransferase [Vibrio agarilyticus]